jgi:hypothetical protein
MKTTGNGKAISDASSELLNWKVVGSNQTLRILSKNVIVKPILTSHTSLKHTNFIWNTFYTMSTEVNWA